MLVLAPPCARGRLIAFEHSRHLPGRERRGGERAAASRFPQSHAWRQGGGVCVETKGEKKEKKRLLGHDPAATNTLSASLPRASTSIIYLPSVGRVDIDSQVTEQQLNERQGSTSHGKVERGRPRLPSRHGGGEGEFDDWPQDGSRTLVFAAAFAPALRRARQASSRPSDTAASSAVTPRCTR